MCLSKYENEYYYYQYSRNASVAKSPEADGMIKILHVKLFFVINTAARHNMFWFSCPTQILLEGEGGRRVKHMSGYNPHRWQTGPWPLAIVTRTGHFPRWCHCGDWRPARCHPAEAILSVETFIGANTLWLFCLAAQFFRAESPVGAVCDLATITDCPRCRWWGCEGTTGWSASARHSRS